MATDMDSFGQVRYIARNYFQARVAVGNMVTFMLFKVVLSHWLHVIGYILRVYSNLPLWLTDILKGWARSEDVGFLLSVDGLPMTHI